MMDKNNKQYKIARSKKRIELRNIWKADRRSLQGCKMLISAEEAEARMKEELAKEAEAKAAEEAAKQAELDAKAAEVEAAHKANEA